MCILVTFIMWGKIKYEQIVVGLPLCNCILHLASCKRNNAMVYNISIYFAQSHDKIVCWCTVNYIITFDCQNNRNIKSMLKKNKKNWATKS